MVNTFDKADHLGDSLAGIGFIDGVVSVKHLPGGVSYIWLFWRHCNGWPLLNALPVYFRLFLPLDSLKWKRDISATGSAANAPFIYQR
jgi:hypothetical protein